MKADEQIGQAEKALQAAGARQYVKSAIQDAVENSMIGLESELGAKELSVERTFATLGGIMAMRRLLRAVDRDIRKGQEAHTPPSR